MYTRVGQFLESLSAFLIHCEKSRQVHFRNAVAYKVEIYRLAHFHLSSRPVEEKVPFPSQQTPSNAGMLMVYLEFQLAVGLGKSGGSRLVR
jgi:hypothetical protein